MGIIETLQAEIQSLKERVTALEQLTKGSDAPAPTTHQLTRDDIIEMAKRDVAELKDEMLNMHFSFASRNTNGRSYPRTTKPEFIVNKEKRTVVALVRGASNPANIYARGIAKCHPDDCFNAAIGRAIALRRALGLEVPDEYLNAPQPTEVRVGDVVCGKYDGDSYYYSKYRRFTLTRECEDKDAFRYAEDPSDWICRDQIGKVIDDSRE
jgi:hypothetical protein